MVHWVPFVHTHILKILLASIKVNISSVWYLYLRSVKCYFCGSLWQSFFLCVQRRAAICCSCFFLFLVLLDIRLCRRVSCKIGLGCLSVRLNVRLWRAFLRNCSSDFLGFFEKKCYSKNGLKSGHLRYSKILFLIFSAIGLW